ncbi:hypothetical protein M8C21_002174, partial [Ambrosia artemisiifolia]
VPLWQLGEEVPLCSSGVKEEGTVKIRLTYFKPLPQDPGWSNQGAKAPLIRLQNDTLLNYFHAS